MLLFQAIIQAFRESVISAAGPALKGSNGAFLDSCPGHHCQSSADWSKTKVGGVLLSDAVADWYTGADQGKSAHVDAPFPSNPTC